MSGVPLLDIRPVGLLLTFQHGEPEEKEEPPPPPPEYQGEEPPLPPEYQSEEPPLPSEYQGEDRGAQRRPLAQPIWPLR